MPSIQALPVQANQVFLSENSGFFVRKWTVKECQFLVDSELIDPVKFELIEGEIVSKMGQGRQHISSVSRVATQMSDVFTSQAIQTQAPIGIGQLDEYNDPEPDVAAVRGIVDDYTNKDPNPATDILLCVEVSKTTLVGDKTTKARIYGKHAVREYWIADIENRQLIVHRDPDTESGGYADIQTYAETDTVSPLEKPDAVIRVADLLP